jgi:hypothetical protein
MCPTVLSLALSVVLSQAPATWSLEWSAPAGCAQRDELAHAVEVRLGAKVFGRTPTLFITGATTPGWAATLSLRNAAGDVLGVREVTSEEPSCAALDARLVLVIALLISPNASLTPTVQAPLAQAPSLPELAAPSLLAPPPAATSRLHVDSDDPAVRVIVIQQRGQGGPLGRSFIATTELCGVPCDLPLALPVHLFLAGEGIVPSAELSLDQRAAAQLTLHVRAGHTGPRAWAIAGATLGLSGLVAGVVTLLLGALLNHPPTLVAAAISAGLGATAMGFGLWGISQTATRVTIEPETAP